MIHWNNCTIFVWFNRFVRRLNEHWITRNSIELIFSSVQLFCVGCVDLLARRNDERAKVFTTNGKNDTYTYDMYVLSTSIFCIYVHPIVFLWIRCQYHFDTVIISFSGKEESLSVIQFDQHNLTNRFSAFNNSISIIDGSSSFFFHKSQCTLLWMLLSRQKCDTKAKEKKHHLGWCHRHHHHQ